ncbi:hypothetical protein Ddye_001397 [Dipteronia dyeriana]|uniref:DNA-directed RNA polymerase n=1 Tax=Dipteronia dyeriana TaxID=168575 RepID=A0AAD9XP29_9ROSI|nr:hypothetical protein Ddye_001397 [Dipteronia dyeriana]
MEKKVKQVKGCLKKDEQKHAASVKSAVDKFQLLPEFLKGIKKIVRANDRLVSAHYPSIHIRFKDVRIGEPYVILSGIKVYTTPQMCRLSNLTYCAPILVDIEYTNLDKTTITEVSVPLILGDILSKVLLIQEQLSNNRIIVDTDKKSNINVSVTSSTELVKSKTVIQMEKGKVYLILNQFVKKIPILIVLKAMGMESDQEVVQMVGRDPRLSALLLPSIEECANLDIFTQEKASEYLEGKVKMSTFDSPSSNQEGRGLAILRDVFLANVPVSNNNFRPKCLYIGVMLRRMMEAILNKEAMDEKDYVGNK